MNNTFFLHSTLERFQFAQKQDESTKTKAKITMILIIYLALQQALTKNSFV